MKPDATHEPGQEGPSPVLLILTGASHTGKTSVAREILDMISPPAAFLSVDCTLQSVLRRPEGDPWAQIPLAYDLLQPQIETLLGQGWRVIFESTFTYVPESGKPEFHREILTQMINSCTALGAKCLVAQLSANERVISSRAETSRKLPLGVVAQTVDLHQAAAMPQETLLLDEGMASPREIAHTILNEMRRRGQI